MLSGGAVSPTHKKRFAQLTVATLLSVAIACAATRLTVSSPTPERPTEPEETTLVYILQEEGAIVSRTKVVPTMDVDAEIYALELRPEVLTASVSVTLEPNSGPAPTDPGFAHNAGAFQQTGFYRSDAPDAWELTRGQGVVVGAVDDSFVRNQDLEVNGGWLSPHGSRWTSTRPSGYFRDFAPPVAYGHGTMVAGVIRATLNNKEAVAGAAPEASLVLINSGSRGLVAPVLQAAQPERYGLPYRVQVLNVSMGALDMRGAPAQALSVELAAQSGVLMVASVGNNGERERESVANSSGDSRSVGGGELAAGRVGGFGVLQ